MNRLSRKNPKFKVLGIFVLLAFLISGFVVLINTNNIEIKDKSDFHPEDASLSKLSNWDGLYGSTNCMVYKDNYAFIGGSPDVGLIVASVPFFSIPTVVIDYQFPVGNNTYIHDIAVSANDNYVFLATTNEGVVVLYFDNITETLTRVGDYQGVTYIKDILIEGDFCYFTSGANYLYALNISDPTSPTYLDEYNPGYFISTFCLVNDMIYLACLDDGIVLVNATNPSSLSFDSQDTSVEVFDINVQNDIAFISKDYSIYEIGIYNLTTASYIANYTTKFTPYSVLVEDNILYIPEGEAVELVDIADLANPQQMSYFNATMPGYIFEVHVDRNFIFYIDQENGFEIYDCFDPYDLVFGGFLPLNGYVNDIYIEGTTAYAYAANFTTIVLNIADPANPTPIDYYEGEVVNANKIRQHNDYLYIMDQRGSVEIANTGPPINHITTYDAISSIRDMCLDGNILYLTTANGFEVVNVSDPFNPSLITEYTGRPNLGKVFVYGNQTLFSHYSNSLYIFDVSDTGSISQLSEYALPNSIKEIYWVYNKIITIDNDKQLHVINVSNPSAPSELGSITLANDIDQIIVRNNIAFAYESNTGIRILNLTNPSDITTIDILSETDNYFPSFYVSDDYIALALSDKGMDLYSYEITDTPITTPPPTIPTTPTTPTGSGVGEPKTLLWVGIGTTAGVLFGILPVIIVLSRRSIISKRERLIREAASVFYSCRQCGYPIDKDSIMCEDCGKDVLRCVVCKLPVSLGDSIGQCSLCQAQGHLDHMQEWVSEKNKCPYCLQEMPIESIIPVVAVEEEKKSKKEV